MKFFTADLAGIGGQYKHTPTDFQVEETPLYPCSGDGEHLYLWVEKTGITTRELLNQVSRQLNIRERDIGYAGLKDARALTRQMISIPFETLNRLGTLTLNGAKILKLDRHNNKLRLGHLAGNRFTITLRNTKDNPLPQAEAIITELKKRGVPNFFGEQRYGVLGNSARLGRLLLQQDFVGFCEEFIGDPTLIRNPEWRAAARLYRAGDIKAALCSLPHRMKDEKRILQALVDKKPHRKAVFSLPHHLLRFFLSAAQSQLFDQLLFQRLSEVDQLIDGDIAVKHANGACFKVEQAKAEQSRADNFEISPSAPLYGHKVLLAAGIPGATERELLKKNGLQLHDWKLAQGLTMAGERRPLRVPLSEVEIIAAAANTLTLRFSLPKGSYATSVLRELIKES